MQEGAASALQAMQRRGRVKKLPHYCVKVSTQTFLILWNSIWFLLFHIILVMQVPKLLLFYMLCLVSISNKCLASVPRQNINRIGRHLRKCLIHHRETWGVGESFVVRLTLVRWVSDVLLRKNWSSFGFCPNEGGEGPAQIFCHILKRCIFGQYRGLFLPKCQ